MSRRRRMIASVRAIRYRGSKTPIPREFGFQQIRNHALVSERNPYGTEYVEQVIAEVDAGRFDEDDRERGIAVHPEARGKRRRIGERICA